MEHIDQRPNERVLASSFASKFTSKREVFNFLSVEMHAYLCAHDQVTIYFLKDLMAGKKKYISCKNVQYLFCPQYKGLTTESILQKSQEHPEMHWYLPDSRDQHRLPRQWLINVCNTIMGRPFAQWVEGVCRSRNENLANKHDLLIEMDPDIARVYAQSTSISTHKGVGANMLKVGSKRRRTRAEIEEDGLCVQIKEHLNEDLERETASLKKQLLEK